MNGCRIFGLSLSSSDTKFLNILGPVIWVVMAADAVISFTEGRLASGLVSTGVLVVLFCGMIGPKMWRVVDPKEDVLLGKLTSIVTLLGILIMATGFVLRMMTWKGL
jgi:hypothetical protein